MRDLIEKETQNIHTILLLLPTLTRLIDKCGLVSIAIQFTMS